MTDTYDILFAHVVRTLPDSLSERSVLLGALARVLPAMHPAKPTVVAMLDSMALQQKLQAQLPLAFTQGGGK